MTTAVAMEEPVSEPKPAQPAMVASARPPRKRPSRRFASSNTSSAMPATTAKLPMIRKSGSVETCAFDRKPVASVAAALTAGPQPMKEAAARMPTRPMLAAIGTMRKLAIHIRKKAAVTVVPI